MGGADGLAAAVVEPDKVDVEAESNPRRSARNRLRPEVCGVPIPTVDGAQVIVTSDAGVCSRQKVRTTVEPRETFVALAVTCAIAGIAEYSSRSPSGSPIRRRRDRRVSWRGSWHIGSRSGAVAVAVGTSVAVAVGISVSVAVGVGISVSVGVAVGISVSVGVAVGSRLRWRSGWDLSFRRGGRRNVRSCRRRRWLLSRALRCGGFHSCGLGWRKR